MTALVAEITSIEDIQKLVVAGFNDWLRYGHVTVRKNGDLLIFNYNTMAQYEARWNFFELVSRGLILNSQTGEIVARSFDKFFNWFEGGRRASGLTLLFEIIYPDNRIIVDYGDRQDLVLVAARNRFTGEYLPLFPDVYELAQRYGFSLPKVYTFNDVGEILARTGSLSAEEEGYVVEFSDGSRFKFKGDRYLELQRLVTSLTFKNVLRALAAGSIESMLDVVPDEFLGETRLWIEEIRATLASVKATVQAAFDAAPKESRKDFALWVQAHHKPMASYLFALLDGRDIEPLIYQNHQWHHRADEASK